MNTSQTEVKLRTTINAPIESVWATIRTFDGIEKYLSVVSSSHLETDGNQTKRICNVQFGSEQTAEIVERLDFVDDTNRSLGYTIIEAPEPFKDAIGAITLGELSKNQCVIEFSGLLKGENNSEIKKMLEGIYSMMADGLKKLHER